MSHTTHCETLSDLVAFVATVFPGATPDSEDVPPPTQAHPSADG